MSEIDTGILDYIKTHRVAVLATQRKAGAPQMTLIAYQFDGSDFAISVRGFSQKAKNLRHRPEASLAIIDGSTQLIVYGAVTVVEDETEVLRLNRERMRLVSTREETDEELAQRLRREERVILLFKPERFYPTSMG